jgi:hypothetical protein
MGMFFDSEALKDESLGGHTRISVLPVARPEILAVDRVVPGGLLSL